MFVSGLQFSGENNVPQLHGINVSESQRMLLSKNRNLQKNTHRDFPGGPVVKNPPSNAGDVGSIPGRGTKIPHAVGQLNPCALEPTCHN